MLRQSVQTSYRNEFEAKSLRDEQSACKGLLRMFCDVVIELNSELQLVGPAQDLCTFLLRGSTRLTEGTPFVDLMPRDEDKTKFDKLCTCQEGPRAIHVGVRDGNGTLMEVELFSLRFEGLDGLPRCLAGLREYSDAAPPAPQLPHEIVGREQLGTLGPQIVVLDARDSQLKVHKISQELARLTGAAQNSKFVRYVQNSRAFKSWMQSQLKAFMDLPMDGDSDRGSSSSSSSQGDNGKSSKRRASLKQTRAVKTSFPVRLRPRNGSAHWHFCATCTCLFNDDADFSGDAESPLQVQIELRDITRRPGSFRSPRVQSDSVCSDFDQSHCKQSRTGHGGF